MSKAAEHDIMAKTIIAAAHAALVQGGVPSNVIGEAMLAGVMNVAQADPDGWIERLYGAGVIIARDAQRPEKDN